jgi:hypothetical protein
VRTWWLAMVCLAAGAALGLGLLWAAYMVSGRGDEWRGLRDLLANALAPIGLIVAARLAWLETR